VCVYSGLEGVGYQRIRYNICGNAYMLIQDRLPVLGKDRYNSPGFYLPRSGWSNS